MEAIGFKINRSCPLLLSLLLFVANKIFQGLSPRFQEIIPKILSITTLFRK